MDPESLNPFRPPRSSDPRSEAIPDAGRCLQRGFLWRRIEIYKPFPCVLTYSAWNFRQRLYLDRLCVWSQISWVTIRRRIATPIPPEFSAAPLQLVVEIDFGPALFMRDFRIFVGDQLIYTESD